MKCVADGADREAVGAFAARSAGERTELPAIHPTRAYVLLAICNSPVFAAAKVDKFASDPLTNAEKKGIMFESVNGLQSEDIDRSWRHRFSRVSPRR